MSRQHTEAQRQQARDMSKLSQELAAQRREDRFDEFLFLVRAGNSVEDATQRLGTNPVAMTRQAYRWNRLDIVCHLTSAAYRQRHGL